MMVFLSTITYYGFRGDTPRGVSTLGHRGLEELESVSVTGRVRFQGRHPTGSLYTGAQMVRGIEKRFDNG